MFKAEMMPTSVRPEDAEGSVDQEKDEAEQEGGEDKVEEIFDDLLDIVKYSPEAQQAASQALVEQIQQVASQMKETRDVKHFQELQKMMTAHWQELIEMTEDNPELLDRIEDWKKSYVDNKELTMEMINGIKEEITNATQTIQETWDDMQIDMGIIMGTIGKKSSALSGVIKAESWGTINRGSEVGSRSSDLSEFIAECNKVTVGHELLEGALPDYKSERFLDQFNTGLRELVTMATQEELLGELEPVFERLREKSKLLSRNIKDLVKMFPKIKKIRDIKPLEVL